MTCENELSRLFEVWMFDVATATNLPFASFSAARCSWGRGGGGAAQGVPRFLSQGFAPSRRAARRRGARCCVGRDFGSMASGRDKGEIRTMLPCLFIRANQPHFCVKHDNGPYFVELSIARGCARPSPVLSAGSYFPVSRLLNQL